MDDNGVKIVSIVGENACECYAKERIACRGIVIRDRMILLSYETKTGQYMIPGGGIEEKESAKTACVREVAEETGILIEPSACILEIDEFYEEWKYISLYYLGRPIGKTRPCLTERETEVGMEPRWVPLEEAVRIFSEHALWTDTDEMRRGLYLREYTALAAVLEKTDNH